MAADEETPGFTNKYMSGYMSGDARRLTEEMHEAAETLVADLSAEALEDLCPFELGVLVQCLSFMVWFERHRDAVMSRYASDGDA